MNKGKEATFYFDRIAEFLKVRVLIIFFIEFFYLSIFPVLQIILIVRNVSFVTFHSL